MSSQLSNGKLVDLFQCPSVIFHAMEMMWFTYESWITVLSCLLLKFQGRQLLSQAIVVCSIRPMSEALVLCSQSVISHSPATPITQLYLWLLLCSTPTAIMNELQVNEMCVWNGRCLSKKFHTPLSLRAEARGAIRKIAPVLNLPLTLQLLTLIIRKLSLWMSKTRHSL